MNITDHTLPAPSAARPFRACVLGAAPDTGNLGVSALLHSAIAGLASVGLRDVTVFDHGRGVRRFVDGGVAGQHVGLRATRRVHQPESLLRLRLAAHGPRRLSPAAAAIAGADVVLGISGGDSFTDLYGPRRFWSIASPLLAAIRIGTPVVMMPQTWGPFSDPSIRRVAARIARGSALCFARDADSFVALADLLGADFDPARHQVAVDMAFALPARPRGPGGRGAAGEDIRRIATTHGAPIGVNVSGLIDRPDAAATFSLRADAMDATVRFLRWLCRETTRRVLLVPHVLPRDPGECDLGAARRLIERVGDDADGRLVLAEPFDDPRVAKHTIAGCSWFLGTRMHATIAALSSGVAAAALAYSGKTAGVFETVGQGDHVADLRALSTDDVVRRLQRAYRERRAARTILDARLPALRDRLARVYRDVAAVARGGAA